MALASGSNASTAIGALVELRRLGFEPARVQVGDVVFDLVVRTRMPAADGPKRPEAPKRGPLETYLGEDAARLFGGGRPPADEDDEVA